MDRIEHPGKFEGELLHVPELWDKGLEGFADEDESEAFVFNLTPEDYSDFPTIPIGCVRIVLHESDNGFVTAEHLDASDVSQTDFTAAVEEGLEGLDAASTGIGGDCEKCAESHGMEPAEFKDAVECGDIPNEGSFSWSSCGICGSHFGGDRYKWHALHTETSELMHFDDACTDCILYLANGDVPEEWRRFV